MFLKTTAIPQPPKAAKTLQQTAPCGSLAPNTLSKYAECAKWCNENGTATIEDKGDYYECVEIVAPEPTPEEIQEQLTKAVQKYLDTTAQKLNYDNCLSVCSYVDTGVAKFDEEGVAFRQWRSAVWQKGYEIVDAVKAGTRDIPTEEELFAELPTIQLDREELKETSTLSLAKVGI